MYLATYLMAVIIDRLFVLKALDLDKSRTNKAGGMTSSDIDLGDNEGNALALGLILLTILC